MTLRRVSFFTLIGTVVALWITAIGCSLDNSPYTETTDVCTADVHCDDNEPCTVDACDKKNGLCVHTPAADGLIPDGTNGNCKVLQCKGGVHSLVTFKDDVDDGDDCTIDTCGTDGAPLHKLQLNAVCHFQGGLGLCDAKGKCIIDCGYIGDDGAEVDCPTSADKCTLSYCDKAKGQCVTETLDGIPVPGTTPAECGGKFCVAGKEQPDKSAPVGTACVLAGGSAGVCDDKGECIQCNTKDDCKDSTPESECHKWVCASGACANTTEKDGPLPSQVPGDCHTKTCMTGVFSNSIDVKDVKDDGMECTQDICDASTGVPSSSPLPVSSPCGAGGLLVCNNKGECTGCVDDSKCTGGTDCKVPHCMIDMAGNGTCYLAPEPAGKVTSMQVAGDCIDNVCDANGNIVQAYQPSDPQNDNNACTIDTCSAMNMSQHTAVPLGQACSDGGGVVCDAAAHCVGKPCSAVGDCPNGTFCADGVCCDSACNGTCVACTAAKKGASPNGLCGAIVSGDPDSECPGNSSCMAGLCAALGNGAACVNAIGECMSGNCVDGVCCNLACNVTCQSCNLSGLAGTCTNIPLGQPDNFPANICNGVNSCDSLGGCKKNDGQGCVGGMECVHGNCVDGVCCGAASCATCQTCNGSTPGTCTNITLGQQDNSPAGTCVTPNSCDGTSNGAAACKKNDGQSCAAGSECVHGNCVDGVCCGSANCAICQTCNGATPGTCTNLPSGSTDTFPANTCVSPNSCNGGSGASACKKATGQTCAVNTDCASGACVDLVCCGTASCAICQTCNGATPGTCNNLPLGSPDTVPANTCVSPNSCNGMSGASACKKNDGQTCMAGTECVHGNCVDGVCCGSASCATCQTCNGSSAGTCTNIANGSQDNFPVGTCVSPNSCDGTSNGAAACKKNDGQMCSLGTECVHGNCVDGVCCGSAACATCQTCNGATPGTCTTLANGSQDDFPVGTCVSPNSCNGMSGASACKKNDGQMCSMGTECLHGNCVDGVCCGTASCAICQTCNGTTPGTCNNLPSGSPDTVPAGTCVFPNSCNGMSGASACKKNDGQMCMAGTDCVHGNCVDSVCCNTACNGMCQACSIGLTGMPSGTCTDLLPNTDPIDECAGAQVCGMMGTCVPGPNGTVCSAMDPTTYCSSGICVDGYCCNGTCGGACRGCNMAGSLGTCVLYATGTDPELECPGSLTCAGGGLCQSPLAQGSACTLDAECSSNHCIDGVCCATGMCNGFCKSCNQAYTVNGVAGVCDNVKSGQDPDNECSGATPTCDGNGACQ